MRFKNFYFISEENDILKTKIKNKAGKEILVGTALKYDKNDPTYKKAQLLLKKNKKVKVSEPVVSTDKSKTKSQVKPVKQSKQKVAGNVTQPKTGKLETAKISVDKPGTKNKTLKSINTLKSKSFTEDLGVSDSDFQKKIKEHKLQQPVQYKLPPSLKTVCPPKYLQMIERMVNTKPVGEGTKVSTYIKTGGAGEIMAQAGEVLAVVGCGMDDKSYATLLESLSNHNNELVNKDAKYKKPGQSILANDWLKAATTQRQSVIKRLDKMYGKGGYKIEATSWDTEQEVEDMGLSDYKKNKGYSTDIYLKLDVKGKKILDEVSLKKNFKIYLYNGGAGDFHKWTKNLPESANQKVYGQKQKKILEDGSKEFENKIKENVMSPDFEKVRKEIEFKFASKDSDLFKKNPKEFYKKHLENSLKLINKDARKITLLSLSALSKKESGASSYLKKINELHRSFQEGVLETITKNEDFRTGMLNTISENLPLNSISTGEETMALNGSSLDKFTMQKIFGTTDFEKIKRGLKTVHANPPYIAFQAEVSGEIIPIADIEVREKGVGYNSGISFSMALNKELSAKIEKANKEVYG
jgi:hypothetical protein